MHTLVWNASHIHNKIGIKRKVKWGAHELGLHTNVYSLGKMRVFFCSCAYVASIQIKRYAQLVLVIERSDCFRNPSPEKSGSAGHCKVVQSQFGADFWMPRTRQQKIQVNFSKTISLNN